MLLRLLLLFITIPLIELYLLLQLSEITGVGATFLLVVITGIIGSWLAKREGLIAWQKFHAALAAGRMPSREIQDGLMIVFSAALLLTPGLLTDMMGLVMLIPIGRDLVRKWVLAKLFRGFGTVQFHAAGFEARPMQSYDDTKTVEGRATRKNPAAAELEV